MNAVGFAQNTASSFVDDSAGLLKNFIKNLPKYLFEGFAIAVAAYYIPSRKIAFKELAMLGLTGAITFWLLDTFSPGAATGARLGAGFGIGGRQVGFERFCDGQEHMADLPENN
jgi:hypothetical protein